MTTPMRSVAAAIRRASSSATDTAPSVALGEVTAWASPKATVLIGTSSIPNITATAEAAASITVGSRVLLLIHGSIAVIIGTI